VSAFGFGGTNFHVVLQEHIPNLKVVSVHKEPAEVMAMPDWPKPPNLDIRGDAWVIGADDPADMSEKITALIGEINDENSQPLLRHYREEASSHELRCGFAANDAASVLQKLHLIRDGLADPAKRSFFPARGIHFAQGHKDKSKLGIAFLFPGQGSQYPYMLRDLAERFPVVAEVFQEADEYLISLGLPGGRLAGAGGAGAGPHGGVVDWEHREVTVRALPEDVPASLELDVSGLHVGHHLTAGALQVAPGVTIVDDPETIIVTVIPPRVQEGGAETGEAPAEPEVIGGAKGE
jgi:hypothetical protein